MSAASSGQRGPQRGRSEPRRHPIGTGRWHPGALLACLLVAASLPACTHYVNNAETAYGEGRYLEAAEDLAQHETEVGQLSPARRAQYGMYRGLSLLKLGELDAARRWLEYSMEVERMAPGSLAPHQRVQLDEGLLMLRRLTGQSAVDGASPPPSAPVAPPAGPSTGGGMSAGGS